MSELSLTQVKMLAELLGMEYGQKRVEAYKDGNIEEFDTDEEPSCEMPLLMTIIHSDLVELSTEQRCKTVKIFIESWQEVTNSYHEQCKAKYPPVKITNYTEEIF